MNAVTNIVHKARDCNRQALLFARFGEWHRVESMRARRDHLMRVARTARTFCR